MKTPHLNKIIDYILLKSTKDREIEEYINKNKSFINNEIDFLSTNRVEVKDLLKKLFGDIIPISADFYGIIYDLEYFIGFRHDSYKLAAYIIIEACKQLPKNEAEELICLLANKDVDIWMILPALPIVLSEINLNSETAFELFNSLYKITENDLANGNLYKAIGEFSYYYYESAIKLIQLYLNDNYNSHLVPTLLGSVRSRIKADNINCTEFEELDEYFANSSDIKIKKAYNNSWVILCWRDQMNIEELKTRLTAIVQTQNEDEIDDAFNILEKCIIHNRNNETFIEFAINWIENNISICSSEQSKYSVLSLITHLCDYHNSDRIADINRCLNLIINIQPIAVDSGGTWREIEHCLARRLKEDKELFEPFLYRLIQVNPEGMLYKFKDFDYLLSNMKKHNFSNFIVSLLFSTVQKERKVGLLLFNELSSDINFDDIDFKKFSDTQLKIIILESVMNPFLAEDTECFFRFLEPAFRKAEQELKSFFIDEMTLQAINYPGACLSNWEKIENKSDILERVVKSANNYFEKLREIQKSPMKSFSFPSLLSAAIRSNRRFSNNIRKESQEKSVFSKIAKITHLIYGNKSSHFIDGRVSDITSMSEFSHSMEFARMEEIDPEGMRLKRIKAGIELNSLQNQ